MKFLISPQISAFTDDCCHKGNWCEGQCGVRCGDKCLADCPSLSCGINICPGDLCGSQSTFSKLNY